MFPILLLFRLTDPKFLMYNLALIYLLEFHQTHQVYLKMPIYLFQVIILITIKYFF